MERRTCTKISSTTFQPCAIVLCHQNIPRSHTLPRYREFRSRLNCTQSSQKPLDGRLRDELSALTDLRRTFYCLFLTCLEGMGSGIKARSWMRCLVTDVNSIDTVA